MFDLKDLITLVQEVQAYVRVLSADAFSTVSAVWLIVVLQLVATFRVIFARLIGTTRKTLNL